MPRPPRPAPWAHQLAEPTAHACAPRRPSAAQTAQWPEASWPQPPPPLAGRCGHGGRSVRLFPLTLRLLPSGARPLKQPPQPPQLPLGARLLKQPPQPPQFSAVAAAALLAWQRLLLVMPVGEQTLMPRMLQRTWCLGLPVPVQRLPVPVQKVVASQNRTLALEKLVVLPAIAFSSVDIQSNDGNRLGDELNHYPLVLHPCQPRSA